MVISFYLIQLEIKDTKDTDRFPAYIDLHLNIDSKGRLATKRYDKKDNLNFPIVNFPLTCSTFQQHLHMEYISISWYDIPERMDFPDRRLLLTRKLLNQGFLLVKLTSWLRKSYGRRHDLFDRYNKLCVTSDHWNIPLVVNTSWFFLHSWLITGCVIRLTQRVSLDDWELLTLPEHRNSLLVLSRVRATRSLFLYVCFVYRCLSFCTFFLLAIVLHVLLRYTSSDYLFGIFNLFFVKFIKFTTYEMVLI
jgi:hypothetical protein